MISIKTLQIPPAKTPDGDTLGWKLLDAVSTPNLESIARCLTTQRFPYGIIYEATETEILILAIAHMHRRPDYWRAHKQ
jgi:hypothetical protein